MARDPHAAPIQADVKGPTTKEQRKALSTMERKTRKAVEKKAERLETLKIQYIPHDQIVPNLYNPNRQSEHDFELLCRSMEDDGMTQPIIVNDGSLAPEFKYVIVDGEHRWRAFARVFGTWEGDHLVSCPDLPVVFVPMTAEQMKIATLRHNRARGSEDVGLSAEVLRDLRELGALDQAQDALMLDDVELQHMLEDVTAPELLAAKEFSQAWEPETAGIGSEAESKIEKGDQVIASSTLETIEKLRAREQALASALTEEDRMAAKKDLTVFRLSLIFAGEQAALVKQALGERPADRVLELCTAWLEAHPAAPEEQGA
ncbi:MAG TPA: ParB N-terminal domain-containing protein [Anaerolineae bacterium]